MSVRKTDEGIQIKPPEPKWFSLEKIAERWMKLSGQSVDVGVLLHYAHQDLLEIGVQADHWHFRCYKSSANSVGVPIEIESYSCSKFIALDVIALNKFNFEDIVLVESMKSPLTINGLSVEFDDCYIDTPSWSRQASKKQTTLLFRADDVDGQKFFIPQVHKNELLISLEERDRFEKQYGIGTLAGEIPSTVSEDTEKRRLERALGALVLGLANKNGSWGSANNPNISSIVSCALAVVQNETGDTPNGYGKTTLTDTINAAVKACQRELKR